MSVIKIKINNLSEGVLQNAAYDIIKYLFLGLGSSGLSFSLIWSGLKKLFEVIKISFPTWVLIVISISLAFLVSFAVIMIYESKSKKYVPPQKIKSKYDVLNKVVTFTYDGEISTYEAEITLIFNEKVRVYYGTFYWSGSGEGNIEVVNKNHTLNILKRRTRDIEYAVIFDKVYRKNQKLTFKLKGTMKDPNGTFSPYFATSIANPTRKLQIVLKIDPNKYPIKNLEKEIISPIAQDHENSEPISLECDGKYVWNIDAPVLSYKYSLNWDFGS